MHATLMAQEADEAADRIAAQAALLDAPLRALAARLRARPPAGVVTCARGSSDHAALFAKYAMELALGAPVASLGPSVVSVYGRPLAVRDYLFIAISQSGRSPDLVRTLEAARDGGALTVALVNVVDSPLATAADMVLPIGAGEERAVAATKSFLCALSALNRLVAAWSQDAALNAALDALPDQMRDAARLAWFNTLEPAFTDARSAIVLGRGPTLGVAHEAALKLKETSALHAEAISAAEVHHGPKAILHERLPVLALSPGGAGAPAFANALRALEPLGAPVFFAGPDAPSQAGLTALPSLDTGHEFTQPLAHIASFYRFAEALARARGRNPDAPPALKKITETL